MSEKFYTARHIAPTFVLSLLALSIGCAEGVDDPLSVDRSAVTVGKSDTMAPSCSFTTGSAEHQAYCLALSFEACDADAACYYQHTIPLYGTSFCAASESTAPYAFDASCLAAEGLVEPPVTDPAPVVEPTPPVEPTPVAEPAPVDEPTPVASDAICEFPRGSQEHIDYCAALDRAECDADPGCYYQNSIPLYGGSFCAIQSTGPATVLNSACYDGPLPTPPPQAFGQIVITEIMRDPETLSETDGEWIEIFNPTEVPWNLSGCVLSDDGTDRHVIGDLLIGAESLAVLASSADPGFTPDYVYSGFRLSNSGSDEINITCDGVEIARVAYDASWSWTPGHSQELLSDLFFEEENDTPDAWCTSAASYNGDFGTPYSVDGCF